MPEASFNTRVITSLRSKLGDHYEVIPEYEPEYGLNEVQDLAIVEDGWLKMLFDLKSGGKFEQVKEELRRFYGELGEESDLVMAACSPEKLVIFDANEELVVEEFDGDAAEQIAEEVAGFLS